MFRPYLRKGKEEDFGTKKIKIPLAVSTCVLASANRLLEPQKGVSRASVAQTSFTQTVNDATWIGFPCDILLFLVCTKDLKREEYDQKNCDGIVLRAGVVPFLRGTRQNRIVASLTLHRMDTDLPEVDIYPMSIPCYNGSF